MNCFDMQWHEWIKNEQNNPDAQENTEWVHLYEVQDKAKLVDGERVQNKVWLVWEEMKWEGWWRNTLGCWIYSVLIGGGYTSSYRLRWVHCTVWHNSIKIKIKKTRKDIIQLNKAAFKIIPPTATLLFMEFKNQLSKREISLGFLSHHCLPHE